MSFLAQSPSPNNLPTCPYCDAQVESLSIHSGVVRCPDCRMTFWSVEDLERQRDEVIAEKLADSEPDDDDTLFAGQNYGWMAENGEW